MSARLGRFLIVAACALVGWRGEAAETEVRVAAPASWVEAMEPQFVATPAEDVNRGYDYLLLAKQVNAAEEATYYRMVYRITSESALQSGGRLTWTYDPAYEQLTVHHVRVVRDGVVQERLSEGVLKVIQQERELDRHILNGHLTAFVLLEDVRVGDVIDSASTRRGWNPTFDGKLFSTWETGWAVPVRHQRFRMDLPKSRVLRWKGHGPTAPPPVEAEEGEMRQYVWEAGELRPLEPEGETPGWFDAYSYFQFTELASWAEAVAWAEPLYALPAELPEAIERQALELTRDHPSADEKARAILDFVQQEVRYLGMELGAGSYRPNAPAEVLARRFGDCKDKTLLFCALMRAAGLEAYPALVNTRYAARIDAWLPSPHAFDHVIVAIPQEDGYAWVDPTLTHQQGGLKSRGLPNYGRALVVRPGGKALAQVTVPQTAKPLTKIEERFDVIAFDQPARFQVTTTFTGRSADSTRRYFLGTTTEQIAKDYVNYYESVYPGLKSAAPVTWSEDKEKNIVTTVEVYDVPNLWTKQDEDTWKAEFYPKNMSDYAVRPQRVVRSAPLEISHPLELEMITVAHLPEKWAVKDSEAVTEDEAFRATAGIKGDGNVVTMRYTWRSRTDHVPAARIGAYSRALNAYRESLGYTLTWRKPAAPEAGEPGQNAAGGVSRLNWLLVLVVVVTLGVTTPLAIKVACWKPATPPALVPLRDQHLAGLSGWLVLVGFGVIVRPLVLLATVVKNFTSAFDLDVWENITIAGRAGYQTWLGPLIVFEMVGNTLLFAMSVLLIVLFFGKKRAFPPVFVAMLAFSVAFIGADTIAAKTVVEGADSTLGALAQTIAGAAIWIPYALVSRRVKATFTR